MASPDPLLNEAVRSFNFRNMFLSTRIVRSDSIGSLHSRSNRKEPTVTAERLDFEVTAAVEPDQSVELLFTGFLRS